MEGDNCYKYSTVAAYVNKMGLPLIRTAVDVGACEGGTILQLLKAFPESRVDAYEGVEWHCGRAVRNVEGFEKSGKIPKGRVRMFCEAVTGEKEPMSVHLAVGNAGGSWILPVGSTPKDCVGGSRRQGAYVELTQKVVTKTMDEVVGRMGGVDFLKIDCEGCEISSLGGCSVESLSKIRFVGGEYHGLRTFWDAIRGSLRKTHRVQIVGPCISGSIGAFFAARLGPEADILDDLVQEHPRVRGMFFHPFRMEHVAVGAERVHGLPGREAYEAWRVEHLRRGSCA
jgi:FkbM family methyltransferase